MTVKNLMQATVISTEETEFADVCQFLPSQIWATACHMNLFDGRVGSGREVAIALMCSGKDMRLGGETAKALFAQSTRPGAEDSLWIYHPETNTVLELQGINENDVDNDAGAAGILPAESAYSRCRLLLCASPPQQTEPA
jgi:hypothetical protein